MENDDLPAVEVISYGILLGNGMRACCGLEEKEDRSSLESKLSDAVSGMRL